jgi:hypothetical protein
MRLLSLLAAVCLATSAVAAPPPDADGRFREWFRSLKVPGSSAPCCTVADCRMVESRWNLRTERYEARVIREVFSNALRASPLYENDAATFQTAWKNWISRWIEYYGDVPEVWVEIPEARINVATNPTGHAVLCWSTFYRDFNGVFCFIPFQAS